MPTVCAGGWRLALELARAGTAPSLAEAERLLQQETAAPGGDSARRALAVAEIERDKGHRERAQEQASSAVQALAATGPGDARLRREAAQRLALLQ